MQQRPINSTARDSSLNIINPSTLEKQQEQLDQILDLITINVHTWLNELRVRSPWHICTDNTTQDLLGANGIFTWDRQDTLDYWVITISVVSDQSSITDWLLIEWSSDMITVAQDDVFTIVANHGKTFTFGPASRYVRVTYKNGPIAQSKFELETSLRSSYVKPSSHRISDSIVSDDDAELVKSIITGKRDDWSFGNAILDNEDRMQVNSQDYLYWIAEGAIAWHSPLLKFWTRTSILANTQSLIREWTNPNYTYLTSAEILKVSSSSVNDTALWTGTRTIKIYWLDADFNEIDEIVTMNGTNIVSTTKTFIRIFRVVTNTCWSLFKNDGNITITNNTWTNQLIFIPAWDWQTLMTMWTVPVWKVAYITQISASNDSWKGARFSLYTRQLDWGILYPRAVKYRAYLVGWNNVIPFNIPFKIPAKTDIEIRFTTPANAGTTSGGATFELRYENE